MARSLDVNNNWGVISLYTSADNPRMSLFKALTYKCYLPGVHLYLVYNNKLGNTPIGSF